jgi:hypothetical protein
MTVRPFCCGNYCISKDGGYMFICPTCRKEQVAALVTNGLSIEEDLKLFKQYDPKPKEWDT